MSCHANLDMYPTKLDNIKTLLMKLLHKFQRMLLSMCRMTFLTQLALNRREIQPVPNVLNPSDPPSVCLFIFPEFIFSFKTCGLWVYITIMWFPCFRLEGIQPLSSTRYPYTVNRFKWCEYFYKPVYLYPKNVYRIYIIFKSQNEFKLLACIYNLIHMHTLIL